jgi:phosphoribosyl-dephospho-CoA transferase
MMVKSLPYKRHDLLWLSDEGKVIALRNIKNTIPTVDNDEISSFILSNPPVPAIVCRQENPEDNLLCIGFSFPRIIDGVRLRAQSKVLPDCIIDHKTPFDVAKYDKKLLPAREILETIISIGDNHHIELGCFGSVALQLVTGLPYMRENSDLDIYLRLHGNRHDLEVFFQQLLECEKKYGITIDAEIEYQGQYGVKLKELFASGKTMLGKGLYDVVLLEKEFAFTLIYGNGE